MDTSVLLQPLASYSIVFSARSESRCCDTRSLHSLSFFRDLWTSSSTVVELTAPSVASVHYGSFAQGTEVHLGTKAASMSLDSLCNCVFNRSCLWAHNAFPSSLVWAIKRLNCRISYHKHVEMKLDS